jgi:hypothetical protein
MFLKKIPVLILFLLISIVSTSQNKINTFLYEDQVDKFQNNNVLLIGTAASSVSFNFRGKECSISLQDIGSREHHNYASLVFDAKYIGKLRIEKGAAQSFPIKITCDKKHHNLSICKKFDSSFYFFINNSSLVG